MGYSRLFYRNGEVAVLVGDNGDNWVDADEITNGATGINSESRHVCYVGGMDRMGKTPMDTRTPGQLESMAKYVKAFVATHPQVKVAGHYHFAAKACPSFDVEAWCARIGVPTANIYKKPAKSAL